MYIFCDIVPRGVALNLLNLLSNSNKIFENWTRKWQYMKLATPYEKLSSCIYLLQKFLLYLYIKLILFVYIQTFKWIHTISFTIKGILYSPPIEKIHQYDIKYFIKILSNWVCPMFWAVTFSNFNVKRKIWWVLKSSSPEQLKI